MSEETPGPLNEYLRYRQLQILSAELGLSVSELERRPAAWVRDMLEVREAVEEYSELIKLQGLNHGG